MTESYTEFFAKVTKNPPLPFQERYAANAFTSNLLIIPTGLGKTDTVLVPWLYAQSVAAPNVPSRLIFVLPRQNLTAQIAARARGLVQEAKLEVRVLELMASSLDNKEDVSPIEPAIIVATQDIYFSRALNRGYARRPPRWPIDFALYNQDCLLVFDEIQLMDEALATSTQLAAFRETFKTFGPVPSVWMSATVNPCWLETVDSPGLPRIVQLNPSDLEEPIVKRRLYAKKSVSAAPAECRTPRGCATFALQQHAPGTRTLIIVNTVARAREIYGFMRRTVPDVILLHSRFRPGDRQAAVDRLRQIPDHGQIVVATQILEAGVDITSRLLVTDIAPWSSLVQRFGRVNRKGDDKDAEIFWVDKPEGAGDHDPYVPYSAEQIRPALARLGTLTSAAPADLPSEDGAVPYQHVLRRADLIDLFDTTTDLAGNELDVSRFIRAGDDKNAYLGWRQWPQGDEPPLCELDDAELCSVPLTDIRKFVKKHAVYTLNFTTDRWTLVTQETSLYPGMLLVAHGNEGGYTADEGWSPDSNAPVTAVISDNDEIDSDSSDVRSFPKYRQTLAAHTIRVCEKLDAILDDCKLPDVCAAALRAAAIKHDWGKSHEVFQSTMHRNDPSPDLLAKQCGHGKHSVAHFRHELASALAMLQTDCHLAAYLVAAHHGRVRMGIRSMPGESRDAKGHPRTRGISEGDHLPSLSIVPNIELPAVTLSLEVMKFGAPGGSWTSRCLRLLEEYGPFRLAYLEMLLRAADEEASADQGPEAAACPS